MNPVRPTRTKATIVRIPMKNGENPATYPNSPLYTKVTVPISVATNVAMPSDTPTLRPATMYPARSSTYRRALIPNTTVTARYAAVTIQSIVVKFILGVPSFRLPGSFHRADPDVDSLFPLEKPYEFPGVRIPVVIGIQHLRPECLRGVRDLGGSHGVRKVHGKERNINV